MIVAAASPRAPDIVAEFEVPRRSLALAGVSSIDRLRLHGSTPHAACCPKCNCLNGLAFSPARGAGASSTRSHRWCHLLNRVFRPTGLNTRRRPRRGRNHRNAQPQQMRGPHRAEDPADVPPEPQLGRQPGPPEDRAASPVPKRLPASNRRMCASCRPHIPGPSRAPITESCTSQHTTTQQPLKGRHRRAFQVVFRPCGAQWWGWRF